MSLQYSVFQLVDVSIKFYYFLCRGLTAESYQRKKHRSSLKDVPAGQKG